MSETKLTPKVKTEIWLRAGGRCQYPSCNQALWRDDLTFTKMNRAYLAHIVADRPRGPRGDTNLSPLLKGEPSNIMLLCDTHHRLIDKVDVAGHPAELLQRFKQEHEERIERQTAIQTDQRTHIMLLGTRIGNRQGMVNFAQACAAVVPDRYPADERGMRLDLAGNEVNENDPDFWSSTVRYIRRRLERHLADGEGQNGMPLNHLSVFALAPIPVLIAFGKQLGDIYAADVFQRHRNTKDWVWKPLDDEHFDYRVKPPDTGDETATIVAVNLSLSGKVHAGEIETALGYQAPTYTITIDNPHRDFLWAKEQLELFQSHWHRLLAEIRSVHGAGCEIHLFPAVPCSVAVEIGRALLPKSDPRIVVYDHDRSRGGFYRTITL